MESLIQDIEIAAPSVFLNRQINVLHAIQTAREVYASAWDPTPQAEYALPTVTRLLPRLLDQVRLNQLEQEKSATDSLTGLYNRDGFYAQLDGIIELTRRQNERLGGTCNVSLIFIDLDGFKAINDTQGHEKGDLVLQEVGKRIKKGIRSYDLAARIGGDEFLIAVAEIGDEDSTNKAVRLQEAIETPITATENKSDKNEQELNFKVGASKGIVTLNHNELESLLLLGPNERKLVIESKIKAADKLMYQDKKNRKVARLSPATFYPDSTPDHTVQQ